MSNVGSVQRKVGPYLGLAIFVMPYFFSWITLRDGYSTKARVISLLWAAYFIGLFGFVIIPESISGGSTSRPAAERGSFSEQQICKAVISTIMGRSPSIIRVDRVSSGDVYLSYIADGTKWDYRCKLEGASAVWAAEPGRWRTEDDIRYSVTGTMLAISERYPDGSSNNKSYAISQL